MHNLSSRAEAAATVSALECVRNDFLTVKRDLSTREGEQITRALVFRRTQLMNRNFLIKALNGAKTQAQVRSAIESAERSLRRNSINETDMIFVRCYTVPAWHRTATVIQSIPPYW